MTQELKRSILFVGGGIETLPGVKIAKSMGLSVIVSDFNPNAFCAKIADYFLCADTYNVAETLEAVKRFCNEYGAIDAVMCMATDVPLTAAIIAEELGIPGIPTASARIVSDKVLMKDTFKSHSIPIPWYKEIKSFSDFMNTVEKQSFPLILKPVDSRGARGVLFLNNNIDLKWAYETSLSYSPSARIMLEQFLSGPQISTEALVVSGKVYTVGFSDRNYEFLEKYSPHIIENGGDLPSFLSNKDKKNIIAAFEKTAVALKIYNGVIKGDMVLCNGSPYVIEVATRLSGGYFCSHEIPINTGVEFVKLAIQIALGSDIATRLLTPIRNQAVSQRYFFPTPGTVTNIFVPEWIRSNPNIELLEIRSKVGDTILETTHHPSRAGLVITKGETRSDAISLAEKVVKSIEIQTRQ